MEMTRLDADITCLLRIRRGYNNSTRQYNWFKAQVERTNWEWEYFADGEKCYGFETDQYTVELCVSSLDPFDPIEPYFYVFVKNAGHSYFRLPLKGDSLK